jgi:hypothetical protein
MILAADFTIRIVPLVRSLAHISRLTIDLDDMASAEGEVSYHDQARTILGCQHYARGAQIVAPCCGNVYGMTQLRTFWF